MAHAVGAKVFKDLGETVSETETLLSQALVEVENNAAADLKVPLSELYFKVLRGINSSACHNCGYLSRNIFDLFFTAIINI